MLEKVDLTKTIAKEEYQEQLPKLQLQLGRLQRKCRELDIPVMIVFEGFGAAGKGLQIGRMIQSLDPRGFRVYTMKEESEEERLHPFLWQFWTKIPSRGQIAIYDGSWYRKVLLEHFEKKMKKQKLRETYHSICTFEKQLIDDGYLIIKLFLDISQEEQKKRFHKLLKRKETAWRVTNGDLKQNKKYQKYQECIEEMFSMTDTAYAPWNLIAATDKKFAAVEIYSTVIQKITEKIENQYAEKDTETMFERTEEKKVTSVLSKVDLQASCSKEVYKEKLNRLQKELERLHGELYRKRIPVVIGFEGWDAGGKGGAIKRLTERMDPRGYVVNPISAPNDLEKSYHYLWRFWRAMPKSGHIAIFDRTWYGRVMVERIEGFCTSQEWQRAYQEINDMERDLAQSGAIVLKFWMQIDKDEQERRFMERQNNPEKQWKITDEDWRNREKWEEYEKAVDEMLVRTSKEYAPWIVVEGNDKYFARIKVLESVVKAIKERME